MSAPIRHIDSDQEKATVCSLSKNTDYNAWTLNTLLFITFLLQEN